MNKITRKIPCYTCLKLRSFFYWIVTSKELLLDHQLLLYHQRKAHRLDMIIKDHTSIHAIIHEANNRSKLEHYTKHKNQDEKFVKQIYVSLWTHRREDHSNRSYGLKETATERSIHKRKYQTISFMCSNYIKAYIDWIKSNLDLNYKTKVKQIIFYL